MIHRTHSYSFISAVYTESIDVKCLSAVIGTQDGKGDLALILLC